jgi:hypothetical protein
MQLTTDTTMTIAIIDKMRFGKYIAHGITDTLVWGQGAIQPQSLFAREDDQRTLLQAVLSSIEPVTDQELAYSACTDGRIPVRLLSGEAVPVREQMVGADIVSAFHVAETLGASFYKDPNAPVARRVADVAAFLHKNGLQPSSHVGCGAGTSYAAIVGNIVSFNKTSKLAQRVQALLPEGVYDERLYKEAVQQGADQLKKSAYQDLTLETFINAVEQTSGKRAIAELKDDGRGVHGHVEEQIIRLRVAGHAINEAKVAELTAGREVFGVNDSRLERLASLFARGNDKDYRISYLALETFADAAHATLARDLPTYVIQLISGSK